MSQDLSKTIAESFKLFQSELEIQYGDMEGAEQEESPQTKDDHEVNGEPAAKRKKDIKTTCLEKAVTKLTDSTGAQKTRSNEGKFEVLVQKQLYFTDKEYNNLHQYACFALRVQHRLRLQSSFLL